MIGAGESIEDKVRRLLDAGALVTVISREPNDGIKMLAAAGEIHHFAREYRYGDLHGNLLAYIGGCNAEMTAQAVSEAREVGVPLNVVDQPECSSFISPATFRRGDLQIAISTSGSSPAVAGMIRRRLEQQIGPPYALILTIMRRARQFLRLHEPEQAARADKLKVLAAALLDSVEQLDHLQIEHLLRLHLNAESGELGVDLRNAIPARHGPVCRDG